MFKVSKLELTIDFLDPGAPAGFWGGRLRGIYGNALLRACCDHGPMTDYRECASFATCPYPFLFESTVEARRTPRVEAPLRGNRLPPPFVIQAPFLPRRGQCRERIRFNLVSIGGQACELNSVAIGALAAFGDVGINNPQTGTPIRYRLAEVRDAFDGGCPLLGEAPGACRVRDIEDAVRDSVERERMPNEIAIEFMSPTRIVSRNCPPLDDSGRAVLLTDFHNLVLNLCNRIGGLWQLYGDEWPGQAEFYRWRDRLLKSSRQIETIGTDLVPFRDHLGLALSHKSSRQNHQRDLSGFVGKMRFAGEFSEFWTLLGIGEMVHIGNDTSSGLGRYRVHR